ncbi:Telomerase reverse transcriptase [Hypoxylon texense]
MQEEEEPLGATLAAHNFESQSSPSGHQQHYYHHHYQHPTNPAAFDSSDYDDYDYDPNSNLGRQPTLPSEFVSYASSNFHAVHANATSVGPVGVVDPDDFYRTYRGVHTSVPDPAYDELMASTLPVPRQDQNLSPLSNGNGGSAASRHPAVSSTRPGARPPVRSVSAPIDDKQVGATSKARPAATTAYGSRPGQKPSVKDLKKRFDQNAAQSSNPTVRKPAPRIPVRETPSSARYRRVSGSSPTNGQPSYTALRSSVTRDFESGTGTSSAARTTQRNKSVPEDQLSNNSQSFASRIAKPRVSVGSHTQASKSMSNLSPVSPVTSPSSIPRIPQSRALLFGEIVPGELDTGAAGYGIEGARARRTSDSNIQKTNNGRQRSLSHTDVEPSSPSDWYRDANGESAIHDDTETKNLKSTKVHNRSHSDIAGTKPGPVRSQSSQASRLTKPHIDRGPSSTSSRLPVSIRKLSSPSGSSSPTSTRSNSPSTRRRPAVQGKTAAKSIPVARAKTPSSNSNPGSSARRPNRLGSVTPNGNTRLNAYISTPPAKLSPTLRSSRPRQPVSSATTTSSRMKAVERDRSPSYFDSRSGARSNEPGARRRKISMGPIDFASRREQIKLSYTKSIRESEARATARRAAEEKRRKEEAEAEAEAEAARAEIALEQKLLEERRQEDIANDNARSPADAEISAAEQAALTITTNLTHPGVNGVTTNSGVVQKDSPTLGIPGSFPTPGSAEDQDEAPPSAISNTTEFDNEPQTEPPLQREVPIRSDVGKVFSSGDYPVSASSKSEYRSPFEDDCINDDGDGFSINVSLDATAESIPQPLESLPDASEFNASHAIPGSYHEEDDEYSPQPLPSQPYQTKVTIIGRDSDFPPVASLRQHVEPAFTAFSNAQDLEDGNSQLKPPMVSRNFSYGSGNSPNDEQPGPSAGLSEIEEFFVGPIIKDTTAVIRRDSSSKLSEGDDLTSIGQLAVEDSRYSAESRRTMGTAPSLTVPRTSDSMNRASQTTVWTDYSMNSQDAYSDYELKDRDIQNRDSTYRDNNSISDASSLSQPYQYERDSRGSESHISKPHRDPDPTHRQPHQLPELNTGGGFIVDYDRKDGSIPVLPDHSPPPPPDDSSLRDAMSSAPQSEYFDDTRPSSYVQAGKDDQSLLSMDPSRRESEDYEQSESGSRTVYQGSLEITEGLPARSVLLDSQQTLAESIDQSEDTAGLSAKERKRLFTRLETIKEMIDTEAFFIRDMNIVEEIYKGTAEACPKLDDKTIKLIFRNTDQIIKFHSSFLVELKEGVCSVYTPKGQRAQLPKDSSSLSDGTSLSAPTTPATGHLNDDRDRQTSIGPIFIRNMEKMKVAHESFLKNSDHAAKKLIQIQEDPTVKVWLNECNEVARDLTKAWNLDSLLIKPMQRITKYPNLLSQLLHETPANHPDRPYLESAKVGLENAIEEINKTKKNFELVGQIVGRKRKESDVRAGFARAFGKRVDKLQATHRLAEDPEYLKLHERFGDDYLRLQVVLRDVEYYARQVQDYVHVFLQYLSSMELVMRLQPSPHPEIESKWLSQVRKQVIEPFELVIKSYGNPSLAMKKRAKRRLDYEKSVQLKKSGKKVDKQLSEFMEQYEALNETLKKELPKLSALTEKVGQICLGNFVNIQTQWFSIWKEKVKVVLESSEVPEIADIVSTFQRDYKFQDEQINTIGIVNPASKGRPSQSTSTDESFARLRPRPAELSPRGRGLSLNSDTAPSLPTPDFMKRHSGQFTISPTAAPIPSPHQYYYRDYYAGINGSPITPDLPSASRSLGQMSVRPGTGQSYESSGAPRQSTESGAHARRYSNSTHASPYQPAENQRYSGLFQSALPPSDSQERLPRPSQASSRASSRERQPINGYNVLWLAASLFEFNIETTKHEAGYPYLTYQAGEIFDVIAEKGELWLAKNQDDPNNLVGWLWSKHFAKLADD